MPDNAKQTVQTRTESHSDVATSEAARAYQAALTERQFGEALVKRLREAPGPVTLRNFREEWVSTEEGLVHEFTVELEAAEG